MIDIYTDASYRDACPINSNIFGYSCVILDDTREYMIYGSIKRSTILNYFKLNCNLTDVCIMHGELLAITKALYHFRKSNNHIRIFSDSLTSLELINEDISSKKCIKFSGMLESIKRLMDKIEKNGGYVEMFWIKAHNNTVGNTIADKLASKYKNDKSIDIPKLEVVKNILSKKERKKYNLKEKSNEVKMFKRKIEFKQLQPKYLEVFNNISDVEFYEKEVNTFKEFNLVSHHFQGIP